MVKWHKEAEMKFFIILTVAASIFTAGIALAGETPKNCNPTPSNILNQAGLGNMGTYGYNERGFVADGPSLWLKNANCFGMVSYAAADSMARSLKSGSCSLNDGSTSGMWRLPGVNELKLRVAAMQGFNNNVPLNACYWSDARLAVCLDGTIRPENITERYYVLPVRSAAP